jgi:hypothetical protein
MLVCTTSTSDLAKLSNKKYRGIACFDDVALVDIRSAFWRLCNFATVQYSLDCATAVFLCTLWRKLGAMFDIRKVSGVRDLLILRLLIPGRKWRTWTATLTLIAVFAVCGGLEAGLTFAIRPAYARGLEWPVLFIGIIAFLTLISGYFPIPFELIKRRGRVVGIDFVFLAIDWCGAFFSLISLVAQNEFDVLFGTMYAVW